MDFDVTTLVNYGALGVCLAYFIYKDNKTSKEQKDAVNGLKDAVNGLKEVITVIKEVLMK